MVELEKLKVDFLRSASHELKTPLAGHRIMLENMRWKGEPMPTGILFR